MRRNGFRSSFSSLASGPEIRLSSLLEPDLQYFGAQRPQTRSVYRGPNHSIYTESKITVNPVSRSH